MKSACRIVTCVQKVPYLVADNRLNRRLSCRLVSVVGIVLSTGSAGF